MRTYTIPVHWVVTTEVFIDAETLDEAISKAYEMPDLPPDGEFLEGSMEINIDLAKQYLSDELYDEALSRGIK